MYKNVIISNKESLIDVSIIISCKNEGNNLKWTLDSIMKSKNSLSFEIIVVDDGSEDGSTEFLKPDIKREIYKDIVLIKTKGLGVANARNLGADAAKGEYLFFCDAHIEVPDNWIDNMVNTLEKSKSHIVSPSIIDIKNPLIETYGTTWNNLLQVSWVMNKPKGIVEIPFACGGAFGIRKKVFKKINGFDHFYQGYGVEDQELSLKAWLYGYKIVLNPDIKIKHLFKKNHSYKISKVNLIYNTLCLAYSHFSDERLTKTIGILKIDSDFFIATEEIKRNGQLIINQREKYFKERSFNDDYFFKKFNIQF